MRRHTADDVFAAAVPEHIDPTDDIAGQVLTTWLDRVARAWVWAQWQPRNRPQDIEFATSTWMITCEADQVDEFQPAHDCVECRAGNDKAKAFLRANPGRWVAMANMTYTEVWP